MALLIPATYNWIKEKGKAEGVDEGVAKGRKDERRSQRKRREEAFRRFGIERDGQVVLPNTSEVNAFLDGVDGDEEDFDDE